MINYTKIFWFMTFRCFIRIYDGIRYLTFHCFAKTSVDSYDSLPIENILTLHNVIMLIKSVLKDEN